MDQYGEFPEEQHYWGDRPFTVAFDVDGTLIDANDKPNRILVELAKTLLAAGATVVVWSGGGVDYADTWRRRLGLDAAIALPKTAELTPDIAIDDDGILANAELLLLVKGRQRIRILGGK